METPRSAHVTGSLSPAGGTRLSLSLRSRMMIAGAKLPAGVKDSYGRLRRRCLIHSREIDPSMLQMTQYLDSSNLIGVRRRRCRRGDAAPRSSFVLYVTTELGLSPGMLGMV